MATMDASCLSALHDRVSLMRRVAAEAGQVAMHHFQQDGLGVAMKPDDSPVTEADTDVESLLRTRILEAFPQDGILGEEHGARAGSSGFRWVIDPIDGTVSFAAGVPLFGTLIAIERVDAASDAVVAGICAMPALRESVWAVAGGGAWWERADASGTVRRTRAHVRAAVPLAEAIVCTSGSEYFDRAGRVDALVAVAKAARRIRGWSDCYGGMLVATGRADAWFDPVMHPWDCGPFPVILAEAGGVFTDWSGTPGIHGGSAIAAAPELHAALLAVVRGDRGER
ncbi:MAG: Histidinol-phosphatase [Planctomycetota bacterium]